MRAGALSDDHRRQLGDDDDGGARDDEVEQHLAHGLVEARRDEHFADAKDRGADDKEPRFAVRERRWKTNVSQSSRNGSPGERVVAQRASVA